MNLVFQRKSDTNQQDFGYRQKVIHGAFSSIVSTPLILIFSTLGSILIARLLGPERYLVLGALSATAIGMCSLFDFGIAKSFSKIIPDIEHKLGLDVATLIANILFFFQLIIFIICWLSFCYSTHIRNLFTDKLNFDSFFYVLLGLRLLISAISNTIRGILSGLLKLRKLNYLSVLQSFLEPVIAVLIVLKFKDPYLVIMSGLALDTLVLSIMSIELPQKGQNTNNQLSLRLCSNLIFSYRSFMAMTHIKFLFNRFIIGNSLIFLILASLDYPKSLISNALIAWSIAAQFWTIADIPFSQFYAPIVSKLHASRDCERFVIIQSLTTVICIISSSLLSIIVLTIATPILTFLYGEGYTNAVAWGTSTTIFALLSNLFSIGNRSLQQQEFYKPQFYALLAATMMLFVCFSVAIITTSKTNLPIALLFSVVLARFLFWIITDIVAELKLKQDNNIKLKLKGLASASLVLIILYIFEAQSLVGKFTNCIFGILLYCAFFKVMGGMGALNRERFKKIFGEKVNLLVNLV